MNHCIICGAPISDNNPDGIGFTCRRELDKWLASEAFRIHADDMSLYYNCNLPMLADKISELLSVHTGKKAYRSSFKNSFFPSVVKQVQEKGFLTKKQTDIVLSYIAQEDTEFDRLYFEATRRKKAEILAGWKADISEDARFAHFAEMRKSGITD